MGVVSVVSVLCSLSCLLDFIDTWSWGIDISGVFPKGSKKMSVVWILPGSMWKASLAFCLSCKRALCSLRGQRCISVGQHLCRASTSQTWLGRGQKPVLPLSTALLSAAALCPTALPCCNFHSFSSQNKVRFLLPRKGMFLGWDHWSRDPCRMVLIWVKKEKIFQSVDSF